MKGEVLKRSASPSPSEKDPKKGKAQKTTDKETASPNSSSTAKKGNLGKLKERGKTEK